MNLLADESVDGQVVDRLRSAGHQVQYIAEMAPGIADDVVLDLAHRAQSLLVTADRDLGELVYRQHRPAFGVVLIRLAGLSPPVKAEVVASAISEHADELPGAFTVIAHKTMRVRRLTV